MKTTALILTATTMVITIGSNLSAADWLTAPSFYTHNPKTGKRMNQYSRKGPFYYPPSYGARRRGYRHIRRSVQVGTSSDNYHVVEEFGGPVRPYGEWRFPYRPYSVPYDYWGPPPPVFGVSPYPYGVAPPAGQPPAAGNQPGYGRPPRRGPWVDGNYRRYPPRRRPQTPPAQGGGAG